MAKITKEITENTNHDSLIFTVDFNPFTSTVDEVLKIEAYCKKTNSYADITEILNSVFPKALDNMIDTIDWREVHQEQRAEAYADV